MWKSIYGQLTQLSSFFYKLFVVFVSAEQKYYYAIVRVSLWHQSATSLQIYDDVIVHQLATSLDIQCCTKMIQDGG